MIRAGIALLLSFGIVMLIGPSVLNELRKLKLKQTIYELGPAHQQKQGTPIMGGVMMIIAMFITAIVAHPRKWNGAWDFMLALLAISMLSMAVGFADDYIKVVKKRNLGLTAKQKLAGQVLVSVGFSCYCYFNPMIGSAINIPFANVDWDLGIFYIPLMSLLIMFMVNSANLQDGLDGLLSTVTCVGSAGWCAMAAVTSVLAYFTAPEIAAQMGPQYQCVCVFAMALIGATMGFLRFNYFPAKVFMGDTGSMFIGGAVVGMAMVLRQPLLLLFMSFCPIMSSVSVIIQRYYFKYTRIKYGEGRRVFRMAPIHHHFEKIGMTEPQIIKMYGIITGILTLIAVCSTNVRLF